MPLKLVQLIEYTGVRVVRALPLFFLCLFTSACGTLSPGLVFPGGDNVVVIRNFWFNVEGDGLPVEDRRVPDKDPIGGVLFLYWVDETGNVCHGQPGITGQPGAVMVNAFHADAWYLSDEHAVITKDQMLGFQNIPYGFDLYIERYHPSTLHFIQYGNWLWRWRKDGSTIKDQTSTIVSVPLVISLDTTNAIYPYQTGESSNCAIYTLPVPSPGIPPLDTPTKPGQDPDRCRTLMMPTSNSISYQESMNYCLVNLNTD